MHPSSRTSTFWSLVRATLLALPLLQDVSNRPVDDPTDSEDYESLVGTSWNLSLCEPGLQIWLGGKLVNRPGFVVSSLDWVRLRPLLQGETLEDRVYVWCRTALLFAILADHQVKAFDVEQINKFQGDIILSRGSVDLILAKYFPTQELRTQSFDAARRYQRTVARFKRKIISNSKHHWDVLIKYKFSNARSVKLPLDDRVTIREAMNHWEERTCLRFEHDDGIQFQPHLLFTKGHGCYSWVGKVLLPLGQEISVGEGCAHLGVVAHEIGHALGFFHENNRPDRGQYITLQSQFIRVQFWGNFAKQDWSISDTRGIPYDFSSVMHYTSTYFSTDPKWDKAIVAKDPEMDKVMGQRERVSFFDAKLANIIYCSNSCGTGTLEWDKCTRDGYRDPNACDSCVCPRGFKPPYCQGPADGVNANCGQQVLLATGVSKDLVSPGYNNSGFPSRATCSWLIKSPPNKRIKLHFRGKFNFTEDPFLCEDYVEVRYKIVSHAGPRFCAAVPPSNHFISHGQEVLILVHTVQVNYWQGFEISYQEELCGGCSRDASDDEPKCTRTRKFDCSPDIPRQSINYCYEDERYCCHGFDESGDRCIRRGPPGTRDGEGAKGLLRSIAAILNTTIPF